MLLTFRRCLSILVQTSKTDNRAQDKFSYQKIHFFHHYKEKKKGLSESVKKIYNAIKKIKINDRPSMSPW
jgi:hypothetical protein